MGSWMRAFLLGLGLTALTSFEVAAQDAPISDAPEAHLEVRHDAGPNPSYVPRSETTAVLWSLGCTAVPIALTASTVFGDAEGPDDGVTESGIFFAALLFGPSVGHFYAGEAGRAWLGIGIRLVPAVLATAAAASTWNDTSPDDEGAEDAGYVLLATYGGLLLWDIWDAHNSARKHNEKQRRRLAVEVGAVGDRPAVRLVARW